MDDKSTYVDIWIDVPGLKDYVRRQRKSTKGRRFFLHEKDTFPPLNKRNTRDEAKGLRVTSERCIGELGVRRLSTLNRGQDSPATVSNSTLPANSYCFYPTTLRLATRAKRRSKPTNKHAPPTASAVGGA